LEYALPSNSNHTLDVLLLAHANIMFSRKDLLSSTKKSPKQAPKLDDDQESEDTIRVDELDEELDLDQTKENIWQLLTFNGPV